MGPAPSPSNNRPTSLQNCGRVLLTEEERLNFLRRFRRPRLERLQRMALFKRVQESCKKTKHCFYCGSLNGTVKKCPGALKILHDQYGKNEGALESRRALLEGAARSNEQLRPLLKSMIEVVDPIKALELFRKVPREDCEILDLAERPEYLIMTHVAVPPVVIRPSVEMDTGAGSNEDDITMKLMQIVEASGSSWGDTPGWREQRFRHRRRRMQVNNILRSGLEKGLPVQNLVENWDYLQVQCAMYINSDVPGLPSTFQNPGKPLRGFVQRLKGKQGRFRGNLSGKRVDFTGRTGAPST